MSVDQIIVDTAAKLMQEHCPAAVINDAEAGTWPAALGAALEESGLTLTWVPDDLGGAGAGVLDGFAVLKEAGRFAVPAPLAETLLAGLLLSRAGLAPSPGPVTIAPVDAAERLSLAADGRLSGVARRVPFARWAERIVVLAHRGNETVLALVPTGACAVAPGKSLAGEPRDDVSFDGARPEQIARAPSGLDAALIEHLGAAARAMQMAGALQRILDLSVQQATDRVQFGRPIGKFQAIQHGLAQLAGEAAAASAAADAAAEAIEAWQGALDAAAQIEIAAAKIRVGDAAGAGAAIAHQTHGAMGFTYEHTLHHSTRRLWSWRDEFGSEAQWAIRLGRVVADHGADGLWPLVTGE